MKTAASPKASCTAPTYLRPRRDAVFREMVEQDSDEESHNQATDVNLRHCALPLDLDDEMESRDFQPAEDNDGAEREHGKPNDEMRMLHPRRPYRPRVRHVVISAHVCVPYSRAVEAFPKVRISRHTRSPLRNR